MGHYGCIAATGISITRLLQARLAEDEPVPGSQSHVVLVRTEDFNTDQPNSLISPPALSLYLYRVVANKNMRAAWSAVGHSEDRAILPLDLHYLLTAWAANAEYEQRLLGKAITCLETTPVLTGPLLDPAGDWAVGQSIQLVMDERPTEEIMRIFDSLPGNYKLSVPYIARIARISGERGEGRGGGRP